MRTTATKVQALLETNSLTDGQVDEFIESANLFVTNALGSFTLDTDTLADIERWVSAHLISISLLRQSKKEEAGSAKIEYAGNFNGKGLNMTSYGQMAINLDTTGALAIIADVKTNIQIQALGGEGYTG